MARSITPAHLLTFAAVAEAGNITHASQRLHLSQPAVSGQLRVLQEAVGEPLYHRQGHGIRLTPAGEGLLRYAKRQRHLLGEVEDYVQQLGGLTTGTLKIGASTTIASYLVPYELAAFRERYPGMTVRISTGNTREILQRLTELDLGMVEGPVIPSDCADFEARRWRTDEIVLLVWPDHPLARSSADWIDFSELIPYPQIWREQGSGTRQIVESALLQAELHVQPLLEVAGAEAVKEAVCARLGVGFVSRLALRRIDAGLVGLRLSSADGLTRPLRLLLPPLGLRSRALKAFLEVLA